MAMMHNVPLESTVHKRIIIKNKMTGYAQTHSTKPPIFNPEYKNNKSENFPLSGGETFFFWLAMFVFH